MSNKKENYPSPVIGYSSGYVLFDYQISNLEGKVLTLIESLGLKDTQEKATKDIARDMIYSLYRETMYITGESIEKAREMSKGCNQSRGSSLSGIPNGIV